MDLHAAIQCASFFRIVTGSGLTFTLAADIDNAGIDASAHDVVFYCHSTSLREGLVVILSAHTVSVADNIYIEDADAFAVDSVCQVLQFCLTLVLEDGLV